MNESSTRPFFQRAGEAAAATAAAIKAFMQMLPSAEQLSAGTSALAMLLLSDSAHALIDASNAIGDLLPLDEADDAPSDAPAPPRKPSGDHRHTFDAAGICTKCGKTKSANGRKPAGAVAAEAPPVDTRAMRLPIPPLGDVAADRFSDGGQGSSMVRR